MRDSGMLTRPQSARPRPRPGPSTQKHTSFYFT